MNLDPIERMIVVMLIAGLVGAAVYFGQQSKEQGRARLIQGLKYGVVLTVILWGAIIFFAST